jgi:multidrug resistance protein MdtO
MSATAEAIAPFSPPSWLLWLRRELAPSPGRDAMTLRLVVAVVAVVVVSMTLQTPLTAFSAYMVFFGTKENRVITTIIGIAMAVAATLAVAASLLLSIVTYDAPHLRIPFMAATVCGAMFLSRATVIGPLFFAVGFVLALSQSLTDAAPDAEHLVRGLLWLWVVVVLPVPIFVLVNRLVRPADPWESLQRSLTRRLGSAAAALRRALGPGVAGGRDGAAPPDDALLDEATRGSAALFAQLKFAALIHPDVKRRQASLAAAIVASERLLVASAALRLRDEGSLSDQDRRQVEQLAGRLEGLQASLSRATGAVFESRDESGDVATLPELRDLKQAVDALSDGLTRDDDRGTPPAAEETRKGLFVPDAFTNPDHLRFGIKVTIAAMSCYVIYTALDWPGIRTAFITCCFIALESTGATLHKGLLRLVGCAIGGLLGFFSLMYLVPRMESIVSLALLTAAGTAIAGWVAAGSERTAYAGLQIALAFFLCIFQGFAPDTQFHTIRDRVVGIVLGIVVSSIVFRFVWPERATDRLRSTVARALRTLARLALVPAVGASVPEETRRAEALRRAIGKDLDESRHLAELSALEGEAATDEDRPSTTALRNLIDRAQAVSLTTSVLAGGAELAEWTRLDAPAQSAEAALRAGVAGRLDAAADRAEGRQGAGPGDLDVPLRAWQRAAARVAGNDRVRLVDRLVRHARFTGATGRG